MKPYIERNYKRKFHSYDDDDEGGTGFDWDGDVDNITDDDGNLTGGGGGGGGGGGFGTNSPNFTDWWSNLPENQINPTTNPTTGLTASEQAMVDAGFGYIDDKGNFQFGTPNNNLPTDPEDPTSPVDFDAAFDMTDLTSMTPDEAQAEIDRFNKEHPDFATLYNTINNYPMVPSIIAFFGAIISFYGDESDIAQEAAAELDAMGQDPNTDDSTNAEGGETPTDGGSPGEGSDGGEGGEDADQDPTKPGIQDTPPYNGKEDPPEGFGEDNTSDDDTGDGGDSKSSSLEDLISAAIQQQMGMSKEQWELAKPYYSQLFSEGNLKSIDELQQQGFDAFGNLFGEITTDSAYEQALTDMGINAAKTASSVLDGTFELPEWMQTEEDKRWKQAVEGMTRSGIDPYGSTAGAQQSAAFNTSEAKIETNYGLGILGMSGPLATSTFGALSQNKNNEYNTLFGAGQNLLTPFSNASNVLTGASAGNASSATSGGLGLLNTPENDSNSYSWISDTLGTITDLNNLWNLEW